MGFVVDALSGGPYRLTPEQVAVHMRTNDATCSKKCADSYVAVVTEVDPSREKIDQLIKN